MLRTLLNVWYNERTDREEVMGIQRTRKAVERRRTAAEARQARYDALTHDQKVARAHAAPGKAVRELTRLAKSAGYSNSNVSAA